MDAAAAVDSEDDDLEDAARAGEQASARAHERHTVRARVSGQPLYFGAVKPHNIAKKTCAAPDCATNV